MSTNNILSPVGSVEKSQLPSVPGTDGLGNQNLDVTDNTDMELNDFAEFQMQNPDVDSSDDFGEVYGDNGPSDEELEAQVLALPAANAEDAMKKAMLKLPDYEKKWGLLSDNGTLKKNGKGAVLTFGLERDFIPLPDSMNSDVKNAVTIIRHRDDDDITDDNIAEAYNTIVEAHACIEATSYLRDESCYELVMSQQLMKEDPNDLKQDERTAPWFYSPFLRDSHLLENVLLHYDHGDFPQIYKGTNVSNQSTIDTYAVRDTVSDYKYRHKNIDLRDNKVVDRLKECIHIAMDLSYHYSGTKQGLPLNSRQRKNTLYLKLPTPKRCAEP